MEQEEAIRFNDSYDLNKDGVILHVHEHFQDCLKSGKPVLTGLDEGMKVLRLSIAALESSRERRTVELGDYWTL